MKILNVPVKWFLSLCCLALLIGVMPSQPGLAAANSVLKEGNDFATLVLSDPWDMNEFSDISQYLNSSGQSISLQNISVANGIFSAQSVNKDPNFTALFPGYRTAMLIGKVGHHFPIQSSVYSCLYIARSTNGPANDIIEALWFQDERLNGGVYGHGQYPVANPHGYPWKLETIKLGKAVAGTSWTGSPTWQGLRIDPSVNQVNFSIDWIRLTDCQPVLFTVPGVNAAAAPVDLFLSKSGREIYVGALDSNNQIDVQGVESGVYTYNAKDSNGAVLSSGSLTINQMPIAIITKPSMRSGQDYAETSGTSWNMSNPTTIQAVDCLAYSFSNGIFSFSTNYPLCADGFFDPVDPRIHIYTPKPASPGLYRYFSMKLNTDGPWQNVPDGMIARLIWAVQGNGGLCQLVSQDIPFDVGWNTYSIDLYDAFDGSVEEKTAGCSQGATTWQNSGTAVGFRLDPNENLLQRTLNQQLEWIRLTAMERVTHGTTFRVNLDLNKPRSEISTFNFYYTTSRSAPTQSPASGALVPPPGAHPVVLDRYITHLPMVSSPGVKIPDPDVSFNWDTTNVAPGQYYLCVTVNDPLNSGTYCSDAPVQVD